MKLAEALIVRADMQKKVSSLRERIAQYVLVQEGDRPAEDPNALLRQAEAIITDLELLVFRINKANMTATLKDGTSLTAAIARRDALKLRLGLLENTAGHAARPPDRYGNKEIKWVLAIDLAAVRSEIDAASKDMRLLNTAIQEANWQAEIEGTETK